MCVGIPAGYPAPRVASTLIYYLLQQGDFSAFHRVRSDEIWIHLAGRGLELVLLDREPLVRRLGSVARGGVPLAVVPPGTLQAARPLGRWSLSACLVAPGFEFPDFEMPSRSELFSAYPAHKDLIEELTRSSQVVP